jgi:hypothetical protein
VSAVIAGRTLRGVGAEFGIAPERVRQLVREREASAPVADVGHFATLCQPPGRA